ncbi:MAG: dTMP kinase [Exilispira sp.]
MKNCKNGLFVVFEGLDKCGKTTALNSVKDQFLKNGYKNIITTFEPGDSEIGFKIRPILLDASLHLSNLTEFFLFISDRLEHTLQLILKKLDGGNIVIVDRFHFSTFSYQVYPSILKIKGKNYKDEDELLRLKSLIKIDKIFGNYLFSLIEPDLIFYFFNDKKIMTDKLEKKDRFESRGEEYLKNVMIGYIKSFSYYKNFKRIVYKVPFSNGIEKNRMMIYDIIKLNYQKMINKFNDK